MAIHSIQPANNKSKSTPKWFQPVFFVAAAARLAVISVLLAHSPVTWGINEPGRIARGLVLGQGFVTPFHDASGPTAWLAPVYPTLLAGLFFLFGVQSTASAWAALFLNVTFSSLTAVVVLKLGREHFGETAGLTAGWAWALSPPLLIMPWIRWETCLSALVMSFAFLRTLRLNEQSRSQQWIICGCIWSFAALLNPALLAPLPVIVAAMAWKQRRWLMPFAMMLVIALGVAPWTARNMLSLHKFIPVRSNFWPEAFFGNVSFSLHPTGNSMVYQREGEIAFAFDMRGRTIEHIRSDPKQFARLTGQRMYAFWTQPDQLGPYAALLLLASLFAIFLAHWAGREWFSFACALAFYPLIYYLTYTFARYRHPIEPLMYTLTGYVASHLATRGKRWFNSHVGG